MKISKGNREDAEKALGSYSKNCPAYQSIKMYRLLLDLLSQVI